MAAKYKSVSREFTNIIKSVEDTRTYHGLLLENDMLIFLVSDPTTDKSAAALDVGIGFMSDPPEFPGLAHFCEHMLFLGTAKYPVDNDFNKFLQQHGGSSNAYTIGDNTCFYFDVAPNALKDALERFAQFFLCPLFTESSTEKEVNVVNSEYEKNIQMDTWRLLQLERATGNPKHDFSKFGTGNIHTLWNIPRSKGINIRDELLKFHKEYYSSNIMGLVVIGKETIEELIDTVVPLFSNVLNKRVLRPQWKEHPFGANYVKMQGFVVPVKDIRSLNITFPVPDLHHLYRSNPGFYMAHLIGHEGPGSLLSELRNYGWVNKLFSGYKAGAKGFAFFVVNLDLTEEGINHINEIVTHFFQYLSMLKAQGPQEGIFEECKNLAAMTFRFKDRDNPLSYANSLASVIFDYPMEQVLCGVHLLHDFQPEFIDDLLAMLTPDVIRIAVVGKKYESICTDVEKWYGTRYKLQPIPATVLDMWENVKPHPNFKLPPPNEFIPSSFDLMPREIDNPKYPQLILNNAMSNLWFKQDDEYLLPKAAMHFELESPILYLDPLHYNMTNLFVLLIKDSLNEYVYAAELAGLSYLLKTTKIGIYLFIKGYDDKQHVLLRKIMDRLTNFKFDEKRFYILKEELHRSLKNFNTELPNRHAQYYTTFLISERIWSNDELLSCIDEVTYEGLLQMIPRLLSKVHIESLMHGNMTRKQALALMNIVETALEKNMNASYLMPSQLARDREIQLADGCNYVYEVTNEVHSCSAVEAYFQCGVQETRVNMLLELLSELLSEPCFNVLRTQEQLGYIVSSGPRRSNCAQGLRIVVQSDKAPCYVDGRIEAFLRYFDGYFQTISDEEFRKHVLSLAQLRLVKSKTLHNLSVKYWLEIAARQYNFDRDNIEVCALHTISREELYCFYREVIAYDAPRRRKLSVHVKSASCKPINEVYEDQQFPCTPDPRDGLIPPPLGFRPPEKIKDVILFRYSVGLCPIVPPCFFIAPPPFAIPEKSKFYKRFSPMSGAVQPVKNYG